MSLLSRLEALERAAGENEPLEVVVRSFYVDPDGTYSGHGNVLRVVHDDYGSRRDREAFFDEELAGTPWRRDDIATPTTTPTEEAP